MASNTASTVHLSVGHGGATTSATNDIGHSNTISATTKNHIGHTENQYRPQTISATKHNITPNY